MNEAINELVDVRASSIEPGNQVCIGGTTIVVTAIEALGSVVDLHTEYGPALRMLGTDWVAVVVDVKLTEAA